MPSDAEFVQTQVVAVAGVALGADEGAALVEEQFGQIGVILPGARRCFCDVGSP